MPERALWALRKSFNGLTALTVDVIKQDPLSGHLFVFHNKRRNLMKVLFWDRTGFCILHKRLEQGTFRFPSQSEDSRTLEVDSAVLTLILEGIDLSNAKRRKRYRKPVAMI
ncbi:MAG: IS66 family insertion sequence element accessory protein TnpB [Planctomycetota bacterium]